MINLLPDDYKKELRAARMNVALLRYNLLTVGAIAVLLVAWGIIIGLLAIDKTNADNTSKQNNNQAQSYSQVKKEASDYRTNLSTAKQILANQVDYTDIIMGITKLLPSGVVLDNISLTAQNIGGQTVLAAHAVDYNAVTQLKQNFEQSKLFSNVFFQSITSSGSSSQSYPISISISVKINKVTP